MQTALSQHPSPYVLMNNPCVHSFSSEIVSWVFSLGL